MIEAFKTGAKLPKRVVWEIILGVKGIVDKERSMVSRVVDEGVVCDIIGDTHGVSQPVRAFRRQARGSKCYHEIDHSTWLDHFFRGSGSS